ncbi:alkaline phosphatase PhoX [Micromonospora sp. NBC_00617]|uniref:alkaline phosphatase PhoX n=1 Tax=Micromonospora sp. NBC_00617 TaxID=2903587 RepID=UPI0030DEDE2E
MPSSRRTFLAGGAAAGVGLAVAGGLPSLAQASPSRPHSQGLRSHLPFPPLVDDPKGILALPEGFSYTVVTRTGVTRLDRGQGTTPSDHDGMAVYDAGHGRYTLIQNHEIDLKYTDLTFDGPDNVTVTPWGSLVLAEDGSGASHVLSTIPGGPTYPIARNQLNDSEFCGPTFSADGKVLFVNMQDPGLTLAITGPWEKYLG